jgi:hypothetical protein
VSPNPPCHLAGVCGHNYHRPTAEVLTSQQRVLMKQCLPEQQRQQQQRMR